MPAKTVWKGIEAFRQFLVPIDELDYDPENAMDHGERNLEIVRNSMKQLGQHRIAITTDDGNVLIGNGMLTVARELCWTHLAAVPSGDNERFAKLRAVTDNRSSNPDIGSWWNLDELDKALDVLDDAFDMDDFGWKQSERDLVFADRDGGGSDGAGGEGDSGGGKPIRVTAEERIIIDGAIQHVRESESDGEMREGRCIELICADYLSQFSVTDNEG